MKQNYSLYFSILTFLLVSCGQSHKRQNTTLSGEIVNPKSPYVVILKNEKTIDTVPLNRQNQFYYKFEGDVSKGLYTVLHNYKTHYETQMFYIEEGDSLQLRLNTQEFDESLMYTGDNAVANNFLMLLFLDYRETARGLLGYYKVKPTEFSQKIDSVQAEYERNLKDLYGKGKISKSFKDIAGAVIKYSYLDFKERYYFLINKYNPVLKDSLPEHFLAYRNQINFNDKKLQKYYIYQYFLDDFLKNKSVEDCLNANPNSRDCFELNSTKSIHQRMVLADSIFEIKTLRNRFLKDYGGWLIVHADTPEEVDATLDFLASTDFDKEELSNIQYLGEIQKNQFMGNIGHIILRTNAREEISLSGLLHRPTIIYYWSNNFTSLRQIQQNKIKELVERYPEVDFIGINIDGELQGLEKFNNNLSDNSGDYSLVCEPGDRAFYRNYLNKTVFVDASGEVISASLNLQENQFEENLMALLNRDKSPQ